MFEKTLFTILNFKNQKGKGPCSSQPLTEGERLGRRVISIRRMLEDDPNNQIILRDYNRALTALIRFERREEEENKQQQPPSYEELFPQQPPTYEEAITLPNMVEEE